MKNRIKFLAIAALMLSMMAHVYATGDNETVSFVYHESTKQEREQLQSVYGLPNVLKKFPFFKNMPIFRWAYRKMSQQSFEIDLHKIKNTPELGPMNRCFQHDCFKQTKEKIWQLPGQIPQAVASTIEKAINLICDLRQSNTEEIDENQNTFDQENFKQELEEEIEKLLGNLSNENTILFCCTIAHTRLHLKVLYTPVAKYLRKRVSLAILVNFLDQIEKTDLDPRFTEEISKNILTPYLGSTTLNLSNQNLTSLKWLSKALKNGEPQKIITLDLSNNKITKLEGFDQLTNLWRLKLNNNKLTKLEGLDQLTNLWKLKLNNNKLTEIEGLDQLTNLALLYLENNKLTEIDGLDQLTYLKRLNLNNNKLTEIKGLDKLEELENLYLENNQISKIEGLDQFTNFWRLNLNNNKLTEIKGLDKLTNLNWLGLDNNKISKIEGLDNLTKLEGLHLNNNNITKIEGLDKLSDLEGLHLDNNNITKIEGLDKLSDLDVLYLKNNKIPTEELEAFKKSVDYEVLYK